jgi:hypothetical protein
MSARKPISKKARFEVFKRDAFICQYCGAHPPSVVLEVDHIVPVVEGGDNDPDNLVTACFPCNRGKGAIGLEMVPQSLADKAAETALREEQLRGYNAVLQARRVRIEDDVWRVVEHWTGQDSTSNEHYTAIKRFVERLGVHEVLDAVDVTLGARIRGSRHQFRYFCKVCWNKVSALEEATG